MLGKVLEKMHEGMILSQHEMSAALREFNQLQTRMADLQRLEDKMKVGKIHFTEHSLNTGIRSNMTI